MNTQKRSGGGRRESAPRRVCPGRSLAIAPLSRSETFTETYRLGRSTRSLSPQESIRIGRAGNSPVACRLAALRRLSRANSFCPWAVSGSARWWPSELPTDGQGFCPVGQLVSGLTPRPRVAWVRRIESPLVMTTWAWCSSRSTVALAMVLGMSSSNPAGCRLDERAMERFS